MQNLQTVETLFRLSQHFVTKNSSFCIFAYLVVSLVFAFGSGILETVHDYRDKTSTS